MGVLVCVCVCVLVLGGPRVSAQRPLVGLQAWGSVAWPQGEELLDPDRARRLARGTEEEEQQSTFSQSYENDSVTTPLAAVATPPGDRRHGDRPWEAPGAAAYGVLALGGVALALGGVANMAVLCVVWNNYYMRSAWNYLLAGMAFWDLLLLLLCLPLVVCSHMAHSPLLHTLTCHLLPYMEVTSLGVSSFSLCVLGAGRFLAATSGGGGAVLQASGERRVERCVPVLLQMLLVWLAALLLSSPELLLWEPSPAPYAPGPRPLMPCSPAPPGALPITLPDSLHYLLLRYQQVRVWFCFGCYFCLPVVFTLLCQLATRNVAQDSAHKQRCQGDGAQDSAQKQRCQGDGAAQRRGCTLLAVAGVYAACTLPRHVSGVALMHVDVAPHSAALLELTQHCMLFLKAALTPLMLLCLCRALGQAFIDCCCCCCVECQPITAQGSPGPVQVKLQLANDTEEACILFDKEKDMSAILSISS